MSQNREKYNLLLSNTLIFAIGNLLVKVIAFFLMPIYTSVLTQEQYSTSELLNSAIEIVLPIISLCIIEALYRFSIDIDADHKALFMNSLLILIIGGSVVFFSCILIDYFTNYQYVFDFFVLYLATTFYKVTTQLSRGLGHVKRFAGYGVINALVLIVSNIILLVHFHGGIRAYLLSFSIGYFVAGLCAFLFSKEYRYISIKKIDFRLLKQMLKYSIPSIPNMLSWWINSVSDRYIVSFYWGGSINGLYTAAGKLPAVMNLVSSIFQQAWQYSAAKEIDDKDNNVSFFSNVLRVYIYICCCACALILLLNKTICALLLKTTFFEAWKYVPLLLFAATLGCIGTYFGTFYQALKNNIVLMISTVVGALSNLVLNFIMIPRLGVLGAAIATAISYFIILMIRFFDIKRKITIYIDFKRAIIQFILLLGMVLVASLLKTNEEYLINGLLFFLIIVIDFNYIYKNTIKSIVPMIKQRISRVK